jgi:hypothetical protein
MDDPHIPGAIEELVAEEHELWRRESTRQASEAERRRSTRSESPSADAGISCAGALRGATPDETLTPPRRARLKSLSGTSSSARR